MNKEIFIARYQKFDIEDEVSLYDKSSTRQKKKEKNSNEVSVDTSTNQEEDTEFKG